MNAAKLLAICKEVLKFPLRLVGTPELSGSGWVRLPMAKKPGAAVVALDDGDHRGREPRRRWQPLERSRSPAEELR